ncbi:hypothetical protein FNF29_08061 [Cafeteria roenbergensis]|uniref:Uncharacterized protein n=1 Tax=Cafeteria roenbergensis TaxID=33653 RepID=A0A5A8C3J9_CAFRO|nr:hypothetical protein FNF29_08061 [Cafeteria roenbergensis]|eukprot:KAA0146411.1 hypothetical protein FNF29_08061 [Cafeteria roenbergensis]
MEDMASLREAAIRSVAAVEARVAKAERSLNTPHLDELLARAAGPDPVDATPGNAISVLLAAVPRLEGRLDAAASRASLDELAARVRAEAAVAHDALDSSKASKTTVAALEQAVSSARRRVDGLDAAMARKADISVLAEVEAAAAVVAEEDARLRGLRTDLDALQGRVQAAEAGLRAELERGEQTATILEGAHVEAEAARAGTARLAASVQSQLDTAQAAAAAMAPRVDDIEARLSDLAPKGEAWPTQRGEALEDAVAALRAALDTRATKASVEASGTSIAQLKATLRRHEARLAIAMDFVDWYAAKGDALEHNERVIHARLGKLADEGARQAAAASAAREAFAGAV